MPSTPVLVAAALIVPPLWGWAMYWAVTRFWPVKAPTPPRPEAAARRHHDIDYHI